MLSGAEVWYLITRDKHQTKGRTMNKTNTSKFSALVDEFGYKLLLVELVYKLDDDELENIFDTIADNWDMMFIEDGTELLHLDSEEDYSDDDCPSWREQMQDNYPSCDDGTIFDTPSGF